MSSVWTSEIIEQVDAAAKAAGEAAAEEVRATAIVAALNTSRRLQSKIASDSMHQSAMLEGVSESSPSPSAETHFEDEKVNVRNNNNRVKFDTETSPSQPQTARKYFTFVDSNGMKQSSYYDVISKDFLIEPRNYPHVHRHASQTIYPDCFNYHPFHNPSLPRGGLKAKFERVKNQIKDIFTN